MKRLFSKKMIMLLTCLLLVIATPAAMAVEAPDNGGIEPLASSYLSSYSAYIAPVGSGKVQIWFNVVGTTMMDNIGAARIVLQESTDGVSFSTVKTFEATSYSNMLATNKMGYTSYVSYSGVAGRYYKATVSIYAAKSGGSDSRLVYTASVKAT